jgi:hypothetical protein
MRLCPLLKGYKNLAVLWLLLVWLHDVVYLAAGGGVRYSYTCRCGETYNISSGEIIRHLQEMVIPCM